VCRLHNSAIGASHGTIAKRAFAGRSDRLLSFAPAAFFRKQHESWEESAMEKLLNSLTGTVIAGFVLVIVEILVIRAIH